MALAGYDLGYGYFVLINHPNGYASLYGHLLQPAEVAAGQWVRRGQRIGLAGNTGHSTGPHLHFEVRRFNLLLNPLDVLPKVPLPIDPIAFRSAAATPTATPTPLPTPAAPSTSAAPSATSGAVEDAPPQLTGEAAPTEPPSPTAPPERTAIAAPRRTATPTPAPTPTPVPTMPTPTPSPSPIATVTRTPTPTPTPTPSPPIPADGTGRTERTAPTFNPANGVPLASPGGW